MSTDASAAPAAKTRTVRYPARLGISIFNLVPHILLLVLIGTLFTLNPRLMNLDFVTTKANAGLILVLATVGQTLVILTGGIDLSLGGVISLTNCLAATRMTGDPASVVLWTAIILLIGMGAGFANGCVVSVLGVAPFIATLATWSIFNGLALLVLEQPGGQVSGLLRAVVRSDLLGVPNSIWILLALFALWVLFKRSKWGTQLYAVGSREANARLNGLPVARIKILAYTASGLFAALAGLYRTVEVGLGSPIAGESFILTSAAAVLVGGAALSGGRGDVISSIVGAFVMLFVFDVISFLGVSSFYTPMVQGVFLILAVTLNAAGYRIRLRKALAQ